MTLVVALSKHCRYEGETTSQFVKAIKELSPEDRQWYSDRFKIEFGYEITE